MVLSVGGFSFELSPPRLKIFYNGVKGNSTACKGIANYWDCFTKSVPLIRSISASDSGNPSDELEQFFPLIRAVLRMKSQKVGINKTKPERRGGRSAAMSPGDSAYDLDRDKPNALSQIIFLFRCKAELFVFTRLVDMHDQIAV